jgi:hypothetical protein
MADGRPADGELVFPGTDKPPWTQSAYQSWRRRAFRRAADAAGLERSRPHDLRHSFASLLLHEGRSVIYVARQLGHDARLTLTRYGHVIDELEDSPQIDAETVITEARSADGPDELGWSGSTPIQAGYTGRWIASRSRDCLRGPGAGHAGPSGAVSSDAA